jgi:mRNA-degrading endonuclease toxin of MazEF toxin-antitoxin module
MAIFISNKISRLAPKPQNRVRSPYYFPMRFKDREQCVMLSQLRLWDGKRLTHKMGQLPDDQFEAVKQALRRLLK